MENPASKGASMASVQDSTGVHLDRGMCEEKRTDEPISYSRHLELGRPGMCTCGSRKATKGRWRSTPRRRHRTTRESDPPIVVRDGNTGHTAKEWAGRHREQSTHFQDTITPGKKCQAPCLHRERTPARVLELVPIARHPEEPGAVIPHAGICEGGVG